ncbi:MAG: hypothetical protein H0U74_07375 [Bradymonadaceae bacterium]|nr:hypothetical protein [Lujinxingiaceae bacterium]
MQLSQSQTPLEFIGAPVDVFSMHIDHERPLAELIEECGFEFVHFFVLEALAQRAIHENKAAESVGRYALLSYSHPGGELSGNAFVELAGRNLRPATLRELLHYALQNPEAQWTQDILALGTMRMRMIHRDRAGETLWGQFDIDHSMCQWVVGLSSLGKRRTLVPIEIFLKDAVNQPATLLVRLTE